MQQPSTISNNNVRVLVNLPYFKQFSECRNDQLFNTKTIQF